VREFATLCREGYPKAEPLVANNTFMDDFVTGAVDGNGAISIYYKLSALMKTIKVPIAKWTTSCEELKEVWKAEGQEIQRTTQALGLDWNTEFHTLSVDTRDILNKTDKGPQLRDNCSKRLIILPLRLIFACFRYREDTLPRNLV